MEIVDDMGILGELRTRATELAEFHRIDPAGNRIVTMAPEVIAGDIEVLRTELNTVLFAAAQDGVTYRFDDSIAALDDAGSHVAVTFQSGLRHDFDLVIGADGLHSHTRALTLGPNPTSCITSAAFKHISPPTTFSASATQGCCSTNPGALWVATASTRIARLWSDYSSTRRRSPTTAQTLLRSNIG